MNSVKLLHNKTWRIFSTAIIIAAAFIFINNPAQAVDRDSSAAYAFTPTESNFQQKYGSIKFVTTHKVASASLTYKQAGTSSPTPTAALEIVNGAYVFNFSELTPGRDYTYEISARDERNRPLSTTGEFSTLGIPIAVTVKEDGELVADRSISINRKEYVTSEGMVELETHPGRHVISDLETNKSTSISVENISADGDGNYPTQEFTVSLEKMIAPEKAEDTGTGINDDPANEEQTEAAAATESDDDTLAKIIALVVGLVALAVLALVGFLLIRSRRKKPVDDNPMLEVDGYVYFENAQKQAQQRNQMNLYSNPSAPPQTPPPARTQNPSGLNIEDQPEDMFEENKHRFDNRI